MDVQTLIAALNSFWSLQGCLLLPAWDVEKGAATLGPQTFFRALGLEPWRIAYLDPCRRPGDGKIGHDPLKNHLFFQYQVLLKPFTQDAQALFTASLIHLGINLANRNLEFRDDAWESPIFGAKGDGWEIWMNGREIAQITYFQQCGGITCEGSPLEITYGLERLALCLQNKQAIMDLEWAPGFSYGDIYARSEHEYAAFETEADPECRITLQALLEKSLELTRLMTEKQRFAPALDALMRSAHYFNLLTASFYIPQPEKDAWIAHIRKLSTSIGLGFIVRSKQIEFPKLKD